MSNIVHDLIKMKYVNEGYLPNWPYHLISDDEMCDAFMRFDQDINDKGLPDGPYYYKGYFFLMYPLLSKCLNTDHTNHAEHDCTPECDGQGCCSECTSCDACGCCVDPRTCKCCTKCRIDTKCGCGVPMAYSDLVKAIHYHIQTFKNRAYPDQVMPNWVYSYMLGAVVSVMSPTLDIHDVIHPLGVDNVDDWFLGDQSLACFKASEYWVRRVEYEDSVRFSPMKLDASQTEFNVHPDYIAPEMPEDVMEYGVRIRYTAKALQGDHSVTYIADDINNRPPTMFGEPHVIKHIRINILDPMQEVIGLT